MPCASALPRVRRPDGRAVAVWDRSEGEVWTSGVRVDDTINAGQGEAIRLSVFAVTVTAFRYNYRAGLLSMTRPSH